MSNNSQSANDLLNGGGGPPSFKFETKGDVAKGTITNLATAQAIDFKSQQPKFYDDGNPIMQIVITLALADGEENRLFVKPKMKIAIREAVATAGAEGLEIGGQLAVQYTDDEPPSKPGLNPAKLFSAQYKAPAPSVSAGDLL